MKKPNESMAMLDMFAHPVFLVKDGIITQCNRLAEKCDVAAGSSVLPLIPQNENAYQAYNGGLLSLGVRIAEIDYIATVFRTEAGDVFHLESMTDSPELRAMALAAQHLRGPLSEIMTAADQLFTSSSIHATEEYRQKAGIISKGLYRMLRQVGNMSAASSYRQGRHYGKEMKNITTVINEVMEKAQSLCNSPVTRLAYTPLREDIYCPVDSEMLERAIYNLISNAVKFSPNGSRVTTKLSSGQNRLLFSVQCQVADPELTQGNLFTRYIRDASLENSRQGLGLGIPLVQYAAIAHGGTLLMDQPKEGTVRFTLTLSTLSEKAPVLSSPFPDFDYMGGWDHGLVELSDILLSSAFEDI